VRWPAYGVRGSKEQEMDSRETTALACQTLSVIKVDPRPTR
jgi:hypothetical protein